jgi:hypothetical protein
MVEGASPRRNLSASISACAFNSTPSVYATKIVINLPGGDAIYMDELTH